MIPGEDRPTPETTTIRESRTSIDLWHAPAGDRPDDPLEKWCRRFLDDADRRSAARLKRPATRNQHVIGRGMTRRLIGGPSVDVDATSFERLSGGKPFLAGIDPPPCFNVSHTDGLVLVAIDGVQNGHPGSNRRVIGVDVEPVDRRINLDMAERYFAAPEIRAVQQSPVERKVETFLTIWTLKEAFIKAIGTGLRTPLDAFAVNRIDCERPSLEFLDPELADTDVDDPRGNFTPRHWQLRRFQPRPGFVAALAIGWEFRPPSAKPVDTIRMHRFESLVFGGLGS